jgi:ParB family chromosome partitioning protein
MIRKPLGRGLDALIGTAAPDTAPSAPAEGAALLMVAPDRVVPSPLQPRRHFDSGKLDELAEAIKSQGIIEPLVVRPIGADDGAPRYELIAGERRLRAAKIAGLERVPIVVREVDDRGALEMSLVENLAREELNPIEEARAFVRLNREFDLSHEQIAGRIGKSRPYVTNTMRLLELPIPVVEMVAAGTISAGQARPLLALSSADEQIAAARRIAEQKISARGAEKIASGARPAVAINRPSSGEAAADADQPIDPNLGALAERIQRAMRRKVRIAPQHGRAPGRIEIEYYNDADLTTLAQILTLAGRAVHGEK